MKKSNKLLMIAAAILFSLTGSCEIGLGSAVDVNAPTVEINYPPEGRTIMNTFVLAGNCDDDTYVDSIYVTVENASESAAVKTFSYSKKVEGKTWQININNLVDGNYELPDGKWTANVYVKDSAGRTSGIVSRGFDIDNTAPLLLLSNPNTVGNASNPITFGAIIQIKGEITETHTTSNLRFYYQKVDASGNLTGTEQYLDCGEVSSLSSDTPFVIARNYSTAELASNQELQNLKNNYDSIHSLDFVQPATGDIDQKVFCSFELFDSARIYNTPDNLNDPGSGTGNKSQKYQIKNIENPISTSAEKKISLESSCFILNSDNAPRYAISDYIFNPTATTTSERFKKLATGTKINLSVSAGKDNSKVKPKSVKVSIQEINSDGTDKNPAPAPIVVLEKGSWDDTDDDIKISKGIDINKDMGLRQDHYYKVIVEAQDRNEIDAVPDQGKVFAFHFDSSSLPPEITITNIFKEENIQNRNAEDENTQLAHDVKLSGDNIKSAIYIPVKVDTNGVSLNRDSDTRLSDVIKIYKQKDEDNMTVGIRIKDNNGTDITDSDLIFNYPNKKFSEASATEASYQNFTYEDGIINFEIKIDHNNVDVTPNKYTYSFILEVKGNTDNPKTADKEVSFTVDSKKPEVSNITITPIVKGAAADTINGKVKFEASVKDNFELYDTAYKVCGVKSSDGTIATIASRDFSTTNPSAADFNIDIDTYTNYSTAGYDKIRIYYKAKDSVGNIFNDYDNTNVTAEYKEYTIDQTKDKPVIETLNFTSHTDNTLDVFDNTRKLSLSVTDDDGIGSIEYKFDDGDYVGIPNNQLPANGKPFDILLTGLSAGEHTITVKATDSLNETNYATSETSAISFAIDNDVPTISETTKIGNEEAKFSNHLKETSGDNTGKIILDLNVVEDWGIPENGVTCSDNTVTIQKQSDSLYKAIITPSTTDGTYDYVFTVTDKAGKTASITRKICVDNTPPTYVNSSAAIKTAKSHTNGSWYNKTSLEVELKAYDDNDIEKVEYSLNNGTSYQDRIPLSSTDDTTTPPTLTFKGYVLGVKNGNSIKFKITDKAGNTKEVTPITNIPIDITKPDTIELISEGGDKFSNGSATYTIKVKAKDTDGGSGIQKIALIRKNNSTETPNEQSVTTEPDDSTYTWSNYTASEGDLYVRVTDNADNTAEKFLFKIVVDNELPKAEIKEIKYTASDALLSTNASSEYIDANKKITISGTASDNKQLAKVTLKYAIYNSSSSSYDTPAEYDSISTGDLNNWSFTVDTFDDKTKFGNVDIDGKKVKFIIEAKDTAGNEGNGTTYTTKKEKVVNINQDSDRPVIKITNFSLADMASGYVGESGTSGTADATQTKGRIKIKNQNRINFTVTDDDDVAEVKYSLNGGTSYSDDIKDLGYIDIPEANEGPCSILFKVKDKAGTEFTANTDYTTTTNKLKTPKIKGNESNATLYGDSEDYKDTTVYLVVDRKGPDLNSIKYKSSTNATYPTGDGESSTTALTIGGNYNQLQIILKLKDANGIKNVKLEKGTTVIDLSGKTSGILSRTSNDITYTISNITVPVNVASTDYKLTFEDYEGNSSTESFTIYADSEAPVLSVDSHLENQVVGSSFILKGKVDGADSATTIKYIINKTATLAASSSEWTASTTGTDTKSGTVKGSVTTWRMYIDGDVNKNPTTETHTATHKKLLQELYSSEIDYSGGILYKKNTTEKYTTVKPIYFHFLTEDAVGNKAVKDFALRVDPQGDIPTINVIYPAAGKTLTGKIRVQGSSSIYQDNKIAGIYMQIDPKVGISGPSFTAWKGTDATNVPDIKATNGTTSLSTKLDSGNPIEYIFSRCDSGITPLQANNSAYQNLFGIYVGNKANWDITINKEGELADTSANDIAIRMYIVDNLGNVNIVDDNDYTKVTIDSDVPAIGASKEFAVYQFAWKSAGGNILYTNNPEPSESSKAYTDSGCRTEETEITAVTETKITVGGVEYTKSFNITPYTKNMWLKGEWWLSGSVEDNSGIKTVKVYSSGIETNVLADNITNASKIEKTYSCIKEGNKDYLVSFRVGVQSSNKNAGELSYKIFIEEDETENVKDRDETFYINYDNKVPEINDDLSFASNDVIKNSYGFYELSATAKEEGVQSGFARTVIYFTRNSTESPEKIYDPYIRAKTKSGETVSPVSGNVQSYSSLHKEDGLYWQKKTATSISNKTVTIDAASPNIHKGGLVKLNGTYFTITAVGGSGTSITLDVAPGDTTTSTPIYFAMGIVVDQESEAIGSTLITDNEGYGYYNISDNDDFMVESSITDNGITTWKANINSNNIPDGPITVNYVVFDKAGNYSDVKSVSGKVQNNVLRITGFKLWCDYNGNGQVDEADEVISKYNNAVSVKIDNSMTERAGVITSPSIDTGDASIMTAKDNVYVYPEFIGGNGQIKVKKHLWNGTEEKVDDDYSYFVMGNEGDATYSGIDDEKDENGYYRVDEQGAQIGYYQGKSGYNADDPTATDQKFVLTKGGTLGSDTETPRLFEFEFQDSTDGAASEASMKFKLIVQSENSNPPVITFGKFKYDTTKNTPEKRKVTSGDTYSFVKDMDLTQGHVECEDDWTKLKSQSFDTDGNPVNKYYTGYDGTTTGEYDNDPKVSGKVTVRGIVKDEKRVTSIYLTPISGSEEKVATFDNTGSNPTYKMKVVESSSLKYDKDTGLGFEIEHEINSSEGHTIYWAYTFDSESVNDEKVKIDATFKVKAENASYTGDDAVSETYTMDIVPYITKISTPADSYNLNNPSVYNRTALGHYPLYAMTKGFSGGNRQSANNAYFEIKEGFNLVIDNIESVTAEKDSSKKFTQDESNKAKFTLTNETISGAYEITVTGPDNTKVKTLNNKNLSTAKYNISSNGANNTSLNDDLIFDIWDINSMSAKGPNGSIDDPVMKINPKNGVIGFAFSNGAERFCMPDSTGSYKKTSRSYDVMKHNALTYDISGNSYAVSVGGDIDEKSDNSSTADGMTFMTSRWNSAVVGDNQNSNRDATSNNRLRIESIGLDKGTGDTNGPHEKSKDRFLSQSMATYATVSGDTTETYVYLAYYDDLLQQVKVKAGRTTGNTGSFQNFADVGANSKKEKNANNVQVIAQNTSSSSSIAKEDTLGNAGKYVSIATTNDNYVALVWFDGANLKYTYTTSKLVYEDNGTWTADKGGAVTIGKWNTAATVFSGFGQYCKVVVDANNGVHIVAYDNKNRKMYYAYSSNYTVAPTNAYVVDSYNNVGKNLTLDVATKTIDETTYYVPYIGYWDNTLQLPRYAYLAKPENFQGTNASTAEKNGYIESGSNKGYTGVWDCSIVPTQSKLKQSTINVGVWKDSLEANTAGTLKASTALENKNWVTKYTSSNVWMVPTGSSTNRGFCYGNGSTNGVLGYLISADSTTYIETAQIR